MKSKARPLRRRPTPNLDFHPGRDRQYRSAQPRQFRSRRTTRPRDGPRRIRRAPACALDFRRGIAARRIPLRLELKDFSADLAIARDCAAQTQASLDNHRGGDGYQLKRLRDHHAQSRAALAALEALEEQNRRDRRVDMERRELATAMTVVTVGDLAIVGIPGELFVELGLAIKANPHFAQTFIAGYCNDLIGYIPTRAAYPEGGYEVDTARIAAGSGETIVDTALSALAAMRA